MKQFIFAIVLLFSLAIPAHAMDFTAPSVPDSGRDMFPEETENFSQGLWQILKKGISQVKPSLANAGASCLSLIAIAVMVSIVRLLPGASEKTIDMVACLCVSAVLLRPANTLIRLGIHTVTELSDYGKLLLPVLTGALAAQGGAVTSSAIYAGTMVFDAILSNVISKLIIPMIYIFLCLSAAGTAFSQDHLNKLKDSVKWLITWSMKIILYVFSGYMGITGVVSGSADAAALKATKLTISGMVPVVGSLLADASESILVGVEVMKSAVGIYGLLAVFAVWIGPFLEIGVQYLLLKAACGICGVFSTKNTVNLIKDFSGAMGLLLAMTGTVCLFLLISVVCFIKGVR